MSPGPPRTREQRGVGCDRLGALASPCPRFPCGDTGRVMSQENVEIVRCWFAAIAEGELASELWDADLIVDNIPEFPVTGPYRGYEGLQRWWDDLAEVVEGARVQLDEATRLDDERVLTIQRLVGDMAYTRIPVDEPWAAIWIVRRGKLCRVSGYATRKHALEAAGLSA